MYGREALRRLRESQANRAPPGPPPSPLADVPLDAPMDDATLTVWNGERWVTWETWRAAAPIVLQAKPEDENRAVLKDAACVAGECGATTVRLVKDGGRWLMYVASRKASARRRDFATPYLEHAMRTAEHWYGAPAGGWRAEKGRDGTRREAADLSPQDSTDEEGACKRGDDDLDLGGR